MALQFWAINHKTRKPHMKSKSQYKFHPTRPASVIHNLKAATLLLLLVATAFRGAVAQAGITSSMNWSCTAGGGGASSGGTFSVVATVGQPAAGGSASGDYSLAAGFWGTEMLVQTPGAPL